MSKNTGIQSSSDAADTIERCADMYRGFMSAAEILREYGSMDNAIAERKKITAKCVAETEAAQADLADALVSVQRAVNDAVAISQGAQDSANKLTEDTNEACATEIFNANTHASEILAKAKADAQAVTDRLSVGIASLEARKAALVAEVAAINDRANATNDEAREAEKRLATVRAAIASLPR